MKRQRQQPSPARPRADWFYVLWMVFWLLVVMAAEPASVCADDCWQDPTNLQDCMRTGGFRQAITIIAVLLGTTPVWVAQQLGVTPEEINRLINRDGWAPGWERIKLLDWWRSKSGAPPPEFPDLPGEILSSGRTSVDRIYGQKRAERILRDLGIWNDVMRLDPNDPQRQQKLEMMTYKVKDHKRVKAIALDWKWVRGPGGKLVQVVDPEKIAIVVEEPECKLPPPPPTPQPKPKPKQIPKPKQKPKPKKKAKPKVVKPDKPPDVRDIYNKAPQNYKMAQDLVLSQATGKPPSHGGQDKSAVFKQLIWNGYRPGPDGVVNRPADVGKLRKQLRDDDVVMLGIQNAPTGPEADHYLVIKKGRIWEVQHIGKRGQLDSRPVKDVGAYFRKSRTVIEKDTGRVIRTGVTYRYWAIFRKRA